MDCAEPPTQQQQQQKQQQPSLLDLLGKLIADVTADIIVSNDRDDSDDIDSAAVNIVEQLIADDATSSSDSSSSNDDASAKNNEENIVDDDASAKNNEENIVDDDDDIDEDDSDSDGGDDDDDDDENENDDTNHGRYKKLLVKNKAMLVKNKQRRQLLLVLECLLRKEHLPCRQRNKIDEMVNEFCVNMNDDVHEMITDQHTGYLEDGLDSKRDTYDEVETLLRIFPDQIKRRKTLKYDDEEEEWIDVDAKEEGIYPIHCLTVARNSFGYEVSNKKSIPFVHLFAQLAIEFKLFEEDQRGGLLIKDINSGCNVIEQLVYSDVHQGYQSDGTRSEYSCCLDKIRTCEFNRLRQTSLLVVEDIREYILLDRLCDHVYFPKTSARFLIEWYPACLVQSGITGFGPAPLYRVACRGSLEAFRLLFKYFIRYYPFKKGILHLFQNMHTWGIAEQRTPLQIACGTPCNPSKRKKYMDVVEDVLSQYSGSTPINATDAIIAAAIDPSIHLDGLFFLMRRQPDALISMIKSTTRSTTGVLNNTDNHHGRNASNNTNNNCSGVDGSSDQDNDHDSNDRNDDNAICSTTKNGKRKRK